jgi:hypothetical protein
MGWKWMNFCHISDFRKNGQRLIRQIRDGKYKSNPVRRIEMPKGKKGKMRNLEIPTVIDRGIQQAITQVLSSIAVANMKALLKEIDEWMGDVFAWPTGNSGRKLKPVSKCSNTLELMKISMGICKYKKRLLANSQYPNS